MQHIPAPDLPTGGIIYGVNGIREAYETGKGKVIVRGRATIENEDGRDVIIISEIPFQVNKAYLVEKLPN